MTMAYEHGGVAIYAGSCLDVLPLLKAESVQCIVTSPPFFGLRDYGTATWEGGDAECDHKNGPLASPKSTLAGYTGAHVKLAIGGMPYRDRCGKCGAVRIDQQIGLEATPAAYLAALVRVFAELWRVLKPDGTCWVEIGDSFAGAGYSNHANTGGAKREDGGKQKRTSIGGIRPKSLLLMPHRLAIALSEDGWIVRQEIIWSKPAAMPESVRDRCTRAHSTLFMLSRSERYYYDAAAIYEPAVSDHGSGNGYARPARLSYEGRGQAESWEPTEYRNKRSVWTIPAEPERTPPGEPAHFAQFPTALVRPCILAGSRPGDVVLDPFAGSGTTLLVAKQLERRAIGIELNASYVGIAARRLQQDVLPLFAGAEAAG